MADPKPFNPEDPAQRAAANKANQQQNYAEFSRSVAGESPKVTAEDASAGKKGMLKEYATKIMTAVEDTAQGIRNDVNKTLDNAAIKPGQAATSVERYKARNPGEL